MINEATGRRARSKKLALAGFSTVIIAGASSLAITSGSASGDGWKADAVLRDVNGDTIGKIKFDGKGNGTVVKVELKGVTAGLNSFHGLHLHANDTAGPCDPAAASGPFTNVGGHWNPNGATHGNHSGDLPSILVLDDGTASARSVTGRFNPGDIAGRAVILHGGLDNFANIPTRYVTGVPPVGGPDAATLGAGDAGPRIACGVVEIS